MADFERNYEQIANTELWHLLQQRSEEQGLGRDFVAAVGKVCTIGLDLSKDIIRFFPNFTFHDGSHSAHVCDWMARLLGERTKDLTAHEAALLLMAACCHDIGMSVSDSQKQKLLNPAFSGWKSYFEAHLDDDEEFCRTHTISERMLRNYVRLHHHERIRENLRSSDWPRELSLAGLPWEALLTLCKSHGTSLSRSELKNTPNYDLLMCAVLLRLADLLDYDASRTSDALFRHMGLDAPQTAEESLSAHEHHKNRVGAFDPDIRDGVIRYRAVYDHPQMEHDIREYLDWIERELDHCAESLTQADKRWQDLPLPYKISTDDAERNGYAAGKFCMTMDQDRVIELLTGKNLYSDPGVFVRELLQNSIDAVLMRVKQDPDFSLEDGRIIIDTWPDGAGNTWFRIRDNGTGMDEHIIQNYFLKVGRSYYTSDEFRAANRHAPGGKSYTAISRFGIGILSCFMTDPEGTELKVSTKRFRGNGGNGIRLDVTGLHGYYYLSHEAQHPDYEDSFLQMPSPDGEERGYREEPGTTICVRTNLFRLGSTQSFREILDKYVQFPEIRVEYNGPEGHKEYPTQQELMDAVHALNPDGEVREYVHEIPEAWYRVVLEKYPMAQWKKTPALVMTYYPLDWISDSKKLTGAVITIHLRQSLLCPVLTSLDENGQESESILELNGYAYVDELDHIGCVLQIFEKTLNSRMSREIIVLEYSDGMLLLTNQERWGVATLCSAIRSSGSWGELISYNGILVDKERRLKYSTANIHSAMLLREDFRPEVDIARGRITGLSAEAACCLEMAKWKCTALFGYEELAMSSTRFLTAREIRAILDCHPVWRTQLMTLHCEEDNYMKEVSADDEILAQFNIDIDDLDLPTGLYCLRSLEDMLFVCAWSGIKEIRRNFLQFITVPNTCRLVEGPEDELVLDFPAGLFQLPEMEGSPFAVTRASSSIYNRNHPFSLWLIKNREFLIEQVPAMYDNLIRPMALGTISEEIRETLNTILTRLRDFNGNCFGIHDGLFLTEDDFV